MSETADSRARLERPPNLYLERYETERRAIAPILEAAARERGEDVYYRWGERSFTLNEVNARANRLARGLAASGIGCGDSVAVLMDNSPEYLDVWFALGKLGAIEVPINTAFRGDLLRYQLDNCAAGVVVTDPAYAGAVEAVAGSDGPRLIVAGEGGGLADTYDEDDADLGLALDVSEVGSVLYTSGTTGPSKGVMLSHHQQVSFGMFYAQIVSLGAEDIVLNYLPHFHIAGKFLSTACLLSGARMVLRPRLGVSDFWDEVRSEGVTNFIAVGGVCNMLAAQPERPDDGENPVRVVYGVPAPAQIYDRFERRFQCKLVEAYGSTEAGLVLYTDPDESRPGSCGRPNRYFEIRLVDEQGDDADEGEILIRARLPLLMMSGYHGMPEATDRAWRGGWFHTGDRARRTPDGNYWFLDRIKDSIRRRGENISSFEVERLVGSHPDVAEVAAIPVDAELGEDEVMAFVVPRAGAAIDPEQLFRFCGDSMPYFMVPRFIEVVPELERTPTNKVAKYRLRERGVTKTTWDSMRAGLRMTREGVAATPARSER